MLAHFKYENPFNILALLIADLPQLDPELYQSKDSRDALVDTTDWDNKVHAAQLKIPAYSLWKSSGQVELLKLLYKNISALEGVFKLKQSKREWRQAG